MQGKNRAVLTQTGLLTWDSIWNPNLEAVSVRPLLEPGLRGSADFGAKCDARSSCRRRRTRVSPDYLRRLSEGAQEGAAHAVAIGKTAGCGARAPR
jgi:hypothetical protein